PATSNRKAMPRSSSGERWSPFSSWVRTATFRANADAAAPADFLLGDGLSDMPAGTADLVLNNPPFHSHQATTDATAWRMFTGSRAALRPGGELWVIGNRHLGYHIKLRRLFGNCETVTSDPKFVILRAVKR
ncbi:methyltransferase, partial [Streptomyces sp. NPDC050804]|uniref:class I SAM-dependent methyltransferase n=1 Tax=Streptomyces sp. NPDC050804 TaxID=3154745 RepID=UPI003434DC23